MEFASTQYPISWLKEQYANGRLEIRPSYQRKPVWTARQKSYLIESILLELPVPEIYIQMTTTPDGTATYAVVDGQQRVRTVLQFIGSEQDPDEQEHNKFSLDKLPAESRWRNMAFAEFSDEMKRKFYEYKFVVRYLTTDDDNDVRDMFTRLNKYLTPLNPQELRNATYSGPFAKLVEKLADVDYWAENRIVSVAQIRRMKDLEFVSNLVIGVLHGPQGGASKVVDDYYQRHEDYDDEFPEQRRTNELFTKTLKTVQGLIPEIKGCRWGNMTDFYTLFVAIASQLRTKSLPQKRFTAVVEALGDFETQVDRRLSDETAKVSENAINYVRAVEKGANDKKRRADRQEALLGIIGQFFEEKKPRQ